MSDDTALTAGGGGTRHVELHWERTVGDSRPRRVTGTTSVVESIVNHPYTSAASCNDSARYDGAASCRSVRGIGTEYSPESAKSVQFTDAV